MEFTDKLRFLNRADSFETFDFSTLYTNLSLDSIFEKLAQIIRKMFKNSGSTGILVNPELKKAFWSQGTDYEDYKFYNEDKLLEALKFVLYETYVQFAGNVFKQIQGIPMGGNASPFIADLYLAWQEYCYMDKLVKSRSASDLQLAEKLSLNSRYLDDIGVVNFLGFGSIAKEIYDPSCLLTASDFGYHYDHFLDLNVRIVNGKFIIGIYHKVDDFDFEVISFPFPSSNIHSLVGYNSFYSQLVRFYRLCNNRADFTVRVKMLKFKLSSRGYSLVTLRKSFLRFCNFYHAPMKYGAQSSCDLWKMIEDTIFENSCYVYDQKLVKALTKPCIVPLEDIFATEKQPFSSLLKNSKIVLETIDYTSKSSIVSQGKIAKSRILSQSEMTIVPIPIKLKNPSNHCYFNSVLQVMFRLKDILFGTATLNNNPDGVLINLLYDGLQSGIDTEIAKVKSRFSVYDEFFDGCVQRDAYECFQKVLRILHQGSRYSLLDSSIGLDDSDEFIVSSTTLNFSFTLKKTLICQKCRHSSIFFIPNSALYIHPKDGKQVDTLIFDSLTSNLMKGCVCTNYDINHMEILEFQEPPKILVVVLNRYNYTIRAKKNTSSVLIGDHLLINGKTYHCQAIVNHHGETTTSGHYTTKLIYDECIYNCDDHIVSLTDIKEKSSNTAYMIFYVRSG